MHINACVAPLLSIDLCSLVLACFWLNCDFVLRKLRPSNTARRKCLVKAAAEILWRAGEERQATVVMYDHAFPKKIRRHRPAHISAHKSETKIKMKNVTEVRRFRSDTTRTHTCAACVFPVRLCDLCCARLTPTPNWYLLYITVSLM